MSSIRQRSLFVVFAAIAPGLALVSWQGVEERRLEQAETRQQMQVLANAAALDVERSIEGARQLLLTVASNPDVRRGDGPRCGLLLASLMPRVPEYAYFGAVHRDGSTFCAARLASVPARFEIAKALPLKRALEQGEFSVGGSPIEAGVRPASLPLAHAILDENGGVIGAVVAGLSLRSLDVWTTQGALPGGFSLALVDSNGTILARSSTILQAPGERLQPATLTAAVLGAKGEGSIEGVSASGDPSLYVFTRVDPLAHELHIVLGQPMDKVLAESNRDFANDLIVLTLFALMASAAAWFGTERLLLPPIQRLVSAAGCLAGGDLAARTGLPHGRDEIGRLAAAYDALAESVESRERLRNASEAELTREKELLERILAHIPVMIVFISPSGRTEWVNREWQRVLGWTLDEARSIDILSRMYPDPDERQDVLRYALDPPPGWRDFRTRTKDGRLVDTSWANVVLSDGSGIGIGQDITDRVRAREELQRAYDEYRRLFEHAPIGIARSSSDGQLLSANAALAKILGYRSAEELLAADKGRRPIGSGDREELWGVLHQGEVRGMELRAERSDGHGLWLRVSAQAVPDSDGRTVAIESTVEDITEAKNARVLIEDGRRRLQALFDNTLDALLLADDEGRYIDANPAACALLGYERADLLRMSVWDTAPAGGRDDAIASWRRFLAAGTLTGEFTCLRRDGTAREVEFRSVANVVPGVHLSALRDVTDRKAAETKLRRQAEIIDQTHDAVVSTDLQGYVTSWNKGAERLFGYTPEEALGRHISFLSPLGEAASRSVIGEVLDKGTVEAERRPVTRDGRQVDILLSLSTLRDAHGVPVGTIGYALDISRRKAAERTLEARSEQQAALSTLGRDALEGLEIQALLDRTAHIVARTLRAEYSLILEGPPDAETMLLRAGYGWTEGLVRVGEPVVVEDLRSEDRFTASPLLRDHGVTSGITVTIGIPEQAFGILGVHTTRRREFSADDVHFLQSVAHVLASALSQRHGEEERTTLLRRLIAAQDDERRRIARELHDEAGQALTGVLIGLRGVAVAATLPDAKLAAQRVRELASKAVTEVGRLARGLHPSALDDMGLVAAVRRYVSEYQQLQHIEVVVHADAQSLGRRLSRDQELALYRIVQETLTNVARHAHAKRVEIEIRAGAAEFSLTVVDDGGGFDPSALLHRSAGSRLGLIGIRERVAVLGGVLRIDSRPGAGTTVAVRIPYDQAKAL
jgi:PAS domain S-box-containing protein